MKYIFSMWFLATDIMESGLTAKQPQQQFEIQSRGNLLEFVETLEEENDKSKGY